MKTTAVILLFLFGLLAVQPTVAEVCRLVQTESCCKKNCCEEDKAPCEKKEDNNCCSGGLCTPCSICVCAFTAVIETENFSFARNAENHYLNTVQKQNVHSGFLVSPFQPPELV